LHFSYEKVLAWAFLTDKQTGHDVSASTPSRSLSVVIPAYCEAGNILQTLDNVTRALNALSIVHEVLVIDDGSTDGTADLVTSQAHRFPGVRLLVNDRNRGFGWSYRRGVEAAALEYIVMVHGDNAWGCETLQQFFGRTGDADVIVGYTRAMFRSRTWRRALISKTFTLLLNLITRRRLRYYNGLQIHPAPVLKGLGIESTGYGFQAEVLVKSLRLTRTFIEVPMDLIERRHGESKAFRIKNLIDVARTIARLCALEWTSAGDSTPAQAAGR
jgi:glycosyltransferase involved in cell wall biosynthesis